MPGQHVKRMNAGRQAMRGIVETNDRDDPAFSGRRFSSRRKRIGAIVGVLVAFAGAASWWWFRAQVSPSPAAPPADTGANADSEGPEVVNPGYLGPQACAECHAERVAVMQGSRHFRTCRLPEVAAMPSEFSLGKGSFAARDPRLRFEMTRDGNEFFQTAIQQTPAGEQRTTSRIDLVLGAGSADDVYLTWHADNKLRELPIAWMHASRQWGASPIVPHSGGDFSREMTPRCLECHNTWFAYVPGTLNQYRPDSFVRGVTCEKCHGPGRDHVAFHQAHPNAKSGHSIVHPGQLPRDRQFEVCTQCHSNAVKERGPFLRYRPGEPLESYYRTHVTTYNEDDHVANQIQYLRESKCFKHSDTLTCTTCHDPHRPRQSSGSESLQDACLKCHHPADCPDQPRIPVAVRDNCVGCHMPQYVKINVIFQTEDDNFVPPLTRSQHRIAVYPTARQEVLLGWHRTQPGADSREEAGRLTGSLAAHWLAEANTYRHQYRFLAAVAALREALRFDSGPAVRDTLQETVAIQEQIDADWFEALHQVDEKRFADAILTLRKVLEVKPDLARAHGKLGTAYAVTDQRELAVEHLQNVIKYDPFDGYGEAMLGWLAYLDGRAEEALEHYHRARQIEPYDAQIHYRMGLVLERLGRLPEAVEHYRLSLEIEPKRSDACARLVLALRQQGQANEAVSFARRAARLSEYRDIDVLVTLAETCSEAGRFQEAADTAETALTLASKTGPARV
ncbi:MAG: tetratricopeptide repeat protein, partial [Planctomycetaceae bacterium]|nr:tetratricopeptide repeat protein [Planctomycetaceae bacterium]